MQVLHRLRFCQRLVLMFLVILALPVSAEIIQSPLDSRDYRQLTLDNGLTVILVSDPDADKAAVSMNVGVGSNANPDDRPGLAHFLEHMLFLGTQKYPEAGSYQAFISSHGGSHNAFTAYENTNYFFSVDASALPGALDRFAQFFIAPLFTPEYVDRERHAVDSEFQAKRRDDSRRSFEAAKQALNPEHHYSRFAVGNLDSLSNTSDEAIRDALIRFYERHYSANLMRLAVLGTAPLDELEQQVRDLFEAVPNRNATPYVDTAPLFESGRLPAQLNIETLRDTRQLSLSFPVPASRDYWEQKPLYYLSSLIGYEGRGSLLSYLKHNGLAQGLSAYPALDLPDTAMLRIQVDLTEQGWQQVDQVTESVFSFIELLRRDGIDPELYQEEQQLAEIQFRFMDKPDPMHLVMQLAQTDHYPTEYLLKGDYHLGQFDADLIRRYLDRMTPDNLLLTLEGKSVETSEIEPLYNTPYGIYPISPDRLKRWRTPEARPELQVRSHNPFIATDFSLINTEALSKPETAWSEPGARLWYLPDSHFQRPRANVYFTLLSPAANQGPEQALLASLYTRMVEDQLNETLYDASLAGLSVSLYPHQRGISLRLSGFNDKQNRLLQQVLEVMRQPALEPARFERIKRQLQEQLDNSLKDKPYNRAFGQLYVLLMNSWSTREKLARLDALTLKDLTAFYPQLLQPAELRILAHGNLTRDQAIGMARTIRTRLQPDARPWQATPASVAELPVQDEPLKYNLDAEHHDSTALLYLQGPDDSLRTRAGTALINEIIATPFYTSLRTEKQYGYIVSSQFMPLQERAGVALVVQSPNTDPIKLQAEYRQFLQQMLEQIRSLPEETLERYRRSLLSRINQQDNDLRTRTNRLWREIDRDNMAFDTRQKLSEITTSLSRTDLVELMQQLMQRPLMIRSFGQGIEREIAPEEMQDDAAVLNALKQAQLGKAVARQPDSGN